MDMLGKHFAPRRLLDAHLRIFHEVWEPSAEWRVWINFFNFSSILLSKMLRPFVDVYCLLPTPKVLVKQADTWLPGSACYFYLLTFLGVVFLFYFQMCLVSVQHLYEWASLVNWFIFCLIWFFFPSPYWSIRSFTLSKEYRIIFLAVFRYT